MSSGRQIRTFYAKAKTAFKSGRRISFFDVKHSRFMSQMKIRELDIEGFIVKYRGKPKIILFENLEALEVH